MRTIKLLSGAGDRSQTWRRPGNQNKRQARQTTNAQAVARNAIVNNTCETFENERRSCARDKKIKFNVRMHGRDRMEEKTGYVHTNDSGYGRINRRSRIYVNLVSWWVTLENTFKSNRMNRHTAKVKELKHYREI